MKKILLPLLLLSTLPLFSREYYLSNALAMERELLEPPVDLKAYEWIVEKERSDGQVSRILYREGEVHSRYTDYYREGRLVSSEEERGERKEVTEFTADGNPLTVSYYSHGELTLKETYTYGPSSLLQSMNTSDGRGKEISVRSYNFRPDGSLLSARQVAGDRPPVEDWWSGSGPLQMEKQSLNGRTEYRYYNKEGLVAVKEVFIDDKLVTTEKNSYEGRVLTAQLIESEEGKTERDYAGGKLVHERIFENSVKVNETFWKYKGDLLLQKRRVLEKEYRWEYSYKGDKLVLERLYDGNQLVYITEYENEQDYRKTLYRRGKAFVSIIFKDNRKTGEEYLKEGQVIRKRTFQ